MKHNTLGKLKIKTEIAVVLFFFILLALGMATYSWYIVATAPKVRAIETYMAVIDPMLSIARATDETTQPEEVGNNDAMINEDDPYSTRLRDTTWGNNVTSFQEDTIGIEFAATAAAMDEEIKMATAKIETDGRLGILEILDPSVIGKELKYKNGDPHKEAIDGIRYYTSPTTERICAVGLSTWVRINQPDKDLVVSAANVKIKDAAGTDMSDEVNVGVAFRNVETGELIPAGYNATTGTHSATILGGDTGHAFEANKPYLIETIVYMDGADSTAGGKEVKGIQSRHIDQEVYINIESVTFYDNIAFDASKAE